MKMILNYIFLGLITAVVLVGCKKEEAVDSTVTPATTNAPAAP